MILGIGCDIVEHAQTEKLNWISDNTTLNRVLSTQEIQFYSTVPDKVRYLSGRFAVKEALLKCLGTGMTDGISLTDIDVSNLINGKPIININGDVKRIAETLGISKFHVTLSHTDSSSIAFVVAEG